ncbi:FAD-binding oxidoreductase [Thalassospira sp.]|uniref:NAD(P)/FAD-dependent oxidoreductase n=1 Tax=Thalassospira sp. TaxID=1912094 RepID=UPI0027351487|nr:FAD-dependent oxidoreductase [Thalassospira sp.]MDP2697715.1 FAD-dependent oxidoreductase [Thalassospira sp.]
MLKRFYEPAAYDAARLPDSYWAETAHPLPDCETLPAEGGLKTTVAVIGGGYTGLSAALRLAKTGVDVCVFDMGRTGWGASGRNGGFCCIGGAIASYDDLARQFGTDAARHFARQQRSSIDLVAGHLADWNLDADRHSDGEIVLAHKQNRVQKLQDEARHLREFAGIESELLDHNDLVARGLNATGTFGGLHVKAGFGLHPLKYLAGLHRACQAQGVRIFAQAQITRLDDQAGRYTLTAGNCRITADRVVIATNGYSAENLPDWIGGRLLPVFSGIFTTRPLSNAEQAQQGWTSDLMAYDTRILLHYFRKLPDGRLMFGGRGGLAATPAAFEKAKRQLFAGFRALFPAWRDVDITHHWNGLACLMYSFRPYVGPVPGHRDVWVALGYHGNGVAMGSLCGDLLAGQMTGAVSPGDIGPVLATPPGKFPLPGLRRQARTAAYLSYQLRDRLA